MRKILGGAAAAATMITGLAQAAVTTTTFQVTATVQKTCSVSATALAFGNYTPGAGAISNSTSVAVRCTNGTPYTIALNGGTTSGGTIAQRLMANGANTLEYNLFTTGAFSTLWGDGTTGSLVSGTGAGVGTPNNHTVHGQLPDSTANQAAVTGSFADTITVTVTY
jgi:spore coat protein U-like protein